VGGGSRQAGGGGPWEGSTVKLSCNDCGGREGSGEAMDGASERGSSPGRRMHSRLGGARGRMVSRSNWQRSRRQGKEDQDLRQLEEVVQR